MASLEYEKKRDVDSRIKKLETTLDNLNTALKRVENEQKELKSATETANAEIEELKEQVQGMLRFLFLICLLFKHLSNGKKYDPSLIP